MSLFSLLYYLVATLLYIIFLPALLILSLKHKYKDSIPSRFFIKNFYKFKPDGLWFHSCSLGETVALKPIINRLNNYKINISTTTNTGIKEAKTITKSSQYLPYEIFLPFWITKQKALIVMEAELWFMLFFIAKKKGTKTILINARISDRSVDSYIRFKWFYRLLFANIDKVFCQTITDRDRLKLLGAKDIEVIGNIKVCELAIAKEEYIKPKDIEIITAGSTHRGEEKLILDSIDSLDDSRLILAPRHPERFDEVYSIIEQYATKNSYSYSRFSKSKSFDSDIVLVDMLGELVNIYAISDLVILGGSFEKIGGHNPVEPASFGCKIISGKEIFNQKALYESISNIYQVEKSELKSILLNRKNLKSSKIVSIGTVEPILKYIRESI